MNTPFPVRQDGKFSVEEFFALIESRPEEERWQLIDGFATFTLYRTKLVKSDSELTDEDRVGVFEPATPTTFKQIPVMALELPDAVWAGDQAGPLCAEHYMHRSRCSRRSETAARPSSPTRSSIRSSARIVT